MGIEDVFDEIRQAGSDVKDAAKNLDTNEDHLYGHGFDPDVCQGCPKKEGGTIESCGICGCPLFSLNRVKGGSPPTDCPRTDQHEGK